MLLDLTIVIPTKNEERNLPGCIQSIGHDFAKKIIVVDSGSTDGTLQIAHNLNVMIVKFEWNGHFPKKRNWFLRTHTPDTQWVLFLDADEYLTEEFKEELRAELPGSQNCGYWLSYSIYFMGKKLRGGYPLRKLALFRIGSGEYERIEEDQWSTMDMEIHEHPVINGETGVIHSKIEHVDFNGISQYVAKHHEYAAWEAKRFLKSQVNDFTHPNKWTWKQKLKYRLMNHVLIGPFYFFGSYIFLGGFRDGSRGLAFALLKMSYFTQIYCRIQENRSTHSS